MPSNIYTAGLRNVGSYQVAGHPYLTVSTIKAADQVKVSFPYVTKKTTVIASGSLSATNHLRIHFFSTGAADQTVLASTAYIVLDSHEDSMEFDVKCKEMYLSAPNAAVGFQVYASLTSIQTGSMYALTGTGISVNP